MACLRAFRDRPSAAAAAVIAALWMLAGPARPFSQSQGAGTYTIYSSEGRRPLTVRTSGPNDVLVFSLSQITGLFGLKFTEDVVAGGLMIETRGQRIVAVPGQSFVQVAGRVVSLDGPLERDQKTWLVPLDFLPKALGPAVGQPVVIRRPSRLILLGDVRVPQITGRVERTATGGRVTIEAQPPAPYKISREGNRLVVRFDAVALDASAIAGAVPDFITGVRIDGTTIVIGLGTSAAQIRQDDADPTRLSIEMLPPPPPPPPPSLALPGATPDRPLGRGVDPGTITPPDKATAPLLDISTGQIRTIVIDPGHGGTDTGSTSSSGAMEKDLALDVAKRLKTAIEGRLGLRVLLTRDTDRDVTMDERSSIANNNKADLFVSVHLNASVRPALRGVQVLSLSADEYPELQVDPRKLSAPVIGGGTRTIVAVPWGLAQVPVAARSAQFGVSLAGHLNEKGVPLHPKATDLGPMRILAGVNMPAVLIEMGFLSNSQDEASLANGTLGAAVIEAIVASIADVRRTPDPVPEGSRR
jgi:N-acetylmuramoyl-L-alanine amidase